MLSSTKADAVWLQQRIANRDRETDSPADEEQRHQGRVALPQKNNDERRENEIEECFD